MPAVENRRSSDSAVLAAGVCRAGSGRAQIRRTRMAACSAQAQAGKEASLRCEAQFTAPTTGRSPAACSLPPRSSRGGTSIRSPSRRRAGNRPSRSSRSSPPEGVASLAKFQPSVTPERSRSLPSTTCRSKPIKARSPGMPRSSCAPALIRAKLKIRDKFIVQACDANFLPAADDIAFSADLGTGHPLPGETARRPESPKRPQRRHPAAATSTLPLWPCTLAFAFLGGLDPQSDAVRLAGDQLEDSRLPGAGRREPRPRVRPECLVFARAPLGVHGAGRLAGGATAGTWPGASSLRCPGSRWP